MQAQEIADDRDLSHLALRFGVLFHAASATPTSMKTLRFEDPHTAIDVVTDLFISGIASRDFVRHLGDLRIGFAWLLLRSWLVLSLTHYRSKTACRISSRSTDLIDSIVTVCKMLRERAVLEALNDNKAILESVFLNQIETVTSYTAPPE